MAECWTCKGALKGSWNMTLCGSAYYRTGRYLGIDDGYFLYGELSDWVYCYCKRCWEKEILKLSFVPNPEQLRTLQQENTNLQQQLTVSQQNQNNLQQQLSSARAEAASYKRQLDEITERYKSLNTSGIEKLRDLFKQLTSSQIDVLHTHTNFRVDTFETVHNEQQLQCSTQFVQLSLKQLRSSVDAVIQLHKDTLVQRKQAKESVTQTLTTAGVSEAIIYASTKPLETETEQIEVGIQEWNAFSAVLADVVNELNSENNAVDTEQWIECIEEISNC